MGGNWSLMLAVAGALAWPGPAVNAQEAWPNPGAAAAPANPALEQGWNRMQKKLSIWRGLHLREVKIRQRLARERAVRPRNNNRLGR